MPNQPPPSTKVSQGPVPEAAHGIGAKHAIRVALAEALRRAAEDLEAKPLDEGRRDYNAPIDWPELYTLQAAEGPAALRAVAEELLAPGAAAISDTEEEGR